MSGRDLRLCFLGDSFVAGTGDPEGLGWVGRAAAGLRAVAPVTIYNLGVRGDTSEAIARRAESEVARRLPPPAAGRVALAFGTNDTTDDGGGPRLPLERSLAYARVLLAGLSARWPLLVVGPPPVAEPRQAARLAELTGALAAVCAERRVDFLPIFDALRASPAWMDDLAAGDGMHAGARGYAALAGLVSGSPAWRAWLAG